MEFWLYFWSVYVRLGGMQTIPLTDVKTHLSTLVDEVAATHDRVTITKHGHPAAIILAPDELAEIEETLAWLSSPGVYQRLMQADADFAAGHTMSTTQMLAHVRENPASGDDQ